MKSFLRIVSLIAIVSAFTACPPASKQPLSSSQNSKPDSQFKGVWANAKQSDYVYFHRAGSQTEALVFSSDKKGIKASNAYQFFPTKIGDQSYLNIRTLDLGSHQPGDDYIFARYEFEKGTLKIWTMNEKMVRAAVKSGKLKGTINAKNHYTTLTDSSANLVQFIRKSDPKKLFSEEFGVFRKMAVIRSQ